MTYGITVGSFTDPDFRLEVVHHSFMEISHVARSEPSPLRIVFAENKPEGGADRRLRRREMKYRRATIAPDNWQGEFGSYWDTGNEQATSAFDALPPRRCQKPKLAGRG
jgi:hypothetical protein